MKELAFRPSDRTDGKSRSPEGMVEAAQGDPLTRCSVATVDRIADQLPTMFLLT